MQILVVFLVTSIMLGWGWCLIESLNKEDRKYVLYFFLKIIGIAFLAVCVLFGIVFLF